MIRTASTIRRTPSKLRCLRCRGVATVSHARFGDYHSYTLCWSVACMARIPIDRRRRATA